MRPPDQSILVTGAGGMLATAFKRLLPHAHYATKAEFDITEKGDASVFASNDDPNYTNKRDRTLYLDAENKGSCPRYFSQIRPAVVINCAAYTKVDAAEQNEPLANAVNGQAVGRLAALCRESGATLVHFSTDYVFDGTLRRPLRPDDPVGPQSAYGRSKLLGEQLLQQHAPPNWLIIRTAWLYGPGGPSFPLAILNAARAGKPLSVVDDQTGSPTFTFDLAQATLELIDRGATGIWHIVNDGSVTWHDFAAAILEEFHLQAPLSRTTSAKWKQDRPNSAIRPSYSVLDIDPFEKLTGHRTRHWREALREYAQVMSR
jgi:dTDP-4-dehydrorhamnose reductase